jgi:hypothetical protein
MEIEGERIEVGASVYHVSNRYFDDFVHELGLKRKEPPNLGTTPSLSLSLLFSCELVTTVLVLTTILIQVCGAFGTVASSWCTRVSGCCSP